MRYLLRGAVAILLFGLFGCANEETQPDAAEPTDTVIQAPLGVKVMNPPKTAPTGAPTPPPDPSREDVLLVEPHFTATPAELVAEFSSVDLQSINAKYGGKVVEVQGTICFVDRVTYASGTDYGAIYVNLCPTETYQPKTVRCEFVLDTTYAYSGPKDRLLIVGGNDTLSRGAEVVVRGYYRTLGARDFRMDDCRLMRH